MTLQSPSLEAERYRGPSHTPRLRLKPKAPLHTGYVDGAWWPWSDDLTLEIPDLLAVLSVRLGVIDCVIYNPNDWSAAPRKFATGGRRVRLGWFRGLPRNTVEVVGLDGARVILLVVPPQTDANDAHTTMMTAAQPSNAATVDGLLMISPRDQDRRTPAAVAQERWESEEGTTTSPELAQVHG
jgi:Family of unknown function (DUF5994)